MKQILALLLIFTIFSQFQAFVRKEFNLRPIKQIDETGESGSSLKALLIGDYGTANDDQKKVAEQFNSVGENIKAEFVLSFGDNFYDPNGVSGVDDESWNTHWKEVYQNKSYLKNLKWYGVLGNHDYGGSDLYSEFKYKESGWVIEDFFWTQTFEVQGKKVAIVHIDTSFLAYTKIGESSIPQMSAYFEEQGWNNDQDILDLVEAQLKKHKDYDWIIVTGHHQIGFSCFPVLNTGKLYPLFQKYKVDAYFSGHSHTLSYTQQEGMAVLLSGAGGKSYINECSAVGPMWSKGSVFGFMSMELKADTMTITAHYTADDWKGEWESHVLPSSIRRDK